MDTLVVSDVMSSPATTIAPHTPLPKIKLVMAERQVHRLPVVEGSTLVGIVTLGDLRNAFPSDVLALERDGTRSLDTVRAADIMRTEVIGVEPHTSLVDAVHLLLRHRISGLPVVENSSVVGMLTKSDVCLALLHGDLVAAPRAEAVEQDSTA
jgi:CBS domain-containing protein